MNSSTCLKVTVNGKKFLITGLCSEVSRKDLLCALAKTSDNILEKFKDDCDVARRPRCYGDESTNSTSDENILCLLKGDRESVGDLKSLQILNNLGNNVRIVKRESLRANNNSSGRDRELYTYNNNKSHKRIRQKKQHTSRDKRRSRHNKKINTQEISLDEPDDKAPEEGRYINKRVVNNVSSTTTSTATTTTTTSDFPALNIRTTTKQTLVRGSLDDSDIDSCTHQIRKLKKRQRRCYDDSDVDIYRSLYNIVLHQTIKLQNSKKECQQFARRSSSWLEQNLKVYYIDGEEETCDQSETTTSVVSTLDNINTFSSNNSTTTESEITMNTSTSITYEDDTNDDDLEIDNDSGLPSPEYDSSESNDNQPIRLQTTMTALFHQHSIDDKELSSTAGNVNTSDEKPYVVHSQLKDYNDNVSTKNILQHVNNNDHEKLVVNINAPMCRTDVPTTYNTIGSNKPKSSGKLANYNEDVYLQRRSKSLGDLLFTSRGESGNLPPSLRSDNNIYGGGGCYVTNNNNKNNNNSCVSRNTRTTLNGEIDKEKVKNLLKNLTSDKIINMGVLNPTFLSNNMSKSKKKLEKRKINKADISEPQLLSPTQFRRYGNLNSVEKAALMVRSGVGFGNIGRSVSVPTGEKSEENKDKEKFYSKKLLEVRRSKRSSKCGEKNSITSPRTKTKEKEKCIQPDNPPGDKKWNRTNEKKYCKEHGEKHREHETHEKTKDKKHSKSHHKHRDEHRKHVKHHFAREKSFDTTTSASTTTVSDENEDARSCSGQSRSSNTSNDNEYNHKKELDIGDIEKQIIELTKLKSQHSPEHKYICTNTENSSHFEGTSNSSLNISNSINEENHDVAYQENNQRNINNISNLDDHLHHDDNKNEKHIHDDDIGDALETTSDYSSLNENLKLESIDELDMERSELVSLYTREEANVNELIERILDYNLLMGELSEELDILTLDDGSNENLENLIADEESIYNEIDSVRSLLQSVIDLCAYQRKEMSENLALLDRLDTKVRTKKAGYEILRSGEWRTNSKSAPRSLLKYSKEKKFLSGGHEDEKGESTSVV